jgi:mRNA interferase MazF
MNYSTGDVVLVPIPFTDLTARKVRPAVVIGQSPRSDDLFLVPISSQTLNTEMPLRDWRESGLNVACGIKAQFATIEARIVIKRVGRLSNRDKGDLDALIRGWLKL